MRLFAYAVPPAAVAAAFAVRAGTHSELLSDVVLYALAFLSIALGARWTYLQNRNAGAARAVLTAGTVAVVLAAAALLAAAIGCTYAAYALTRNRGLEALTALSVALPNAVVLVRGLAKVPARTRDELARFRVRSSPF